MSTGLSFAVGHEQLEIFQKFVTEFGHALLGKLYAPKLVPWGMFLHHNIVELSVSLGNVSHYITSIELSNARLYIKNSEKFRGTPV